MNCPDHESAKRPAWKSFFRTVFSLAALFTFLLSSALFTGCGKTEKEDDEEDSPSEKKESVGKWQKALGKEKDRPDLVLAFQAEIHQKFYEMAAREFGEKHHCTVKLLRVPKEMLMDTLQEAMEAGGDVPDLVELLEGTMGYFADCPIDKVGFVDLTDRLKEEGYLDPDNMVVKRYSLWSSRGHIFAIPHDVHPVALCYRVDLIEKLGIDVTKLKTWDDFVRVGRQITGEWEYTDEALGIRKGGKRYMIDFADDSMISMIILLTQRGFDLFDANGNVAFDTPEAAELIAWFVHQTRGPNRISFPAGDGKNFYQAMKEGVDLFFLTPDWRTKQYTLDLGFKNWAGEPHLLKGKLALMPMPVWADKNGGRLPSSYGTGTWGASGLAITKHSKKQELAWEFAKYLYLEASDEDFAYRFRETNIVPPVKRAWSVPGFREDSPYFKQMVRDSDGDLVVRPVSIGEFYASIADDTPPHFYTAYTTEAEKDFVLTYYDARAYYEKTGDDEGMMELIRKQLKEKADIIRKKMK